MRPPVALPRRYRRGANRSFRDRLPGGVLPKDAEAAVTLRARTLTNLYNQRPQWLADAHRDLNAAVAAAYGWPVDISEEDALAKLLELNLARAGEGGLAFPKDIEPEEI